MSALSLRLPRSLHEQIRDIAKDEGVSVNQFITLAVTEKVAHISAIDYLEKRANRGKREKFMAVLDKSSDIKPENADIVQ